MRRYALCLLLALLVGGFSGATPQKRVTHSFKEVDLLHALEVLAKEMGMKILVGPGVHGSVTIDLVDVPAEDALRKILATQGNNYGFKILDRASRDGLLIVATPEILAYFDHREASSGERPRREFLLEMAPAAKVLDFLKGEYPNVEFTPHPTMNGFYARGSRDELLQIIREVPNLDRVPEPPPPPLREFLSPTLEVDAESYAMSGETGFREVTTRPLSTFSIDVDTASYSNVRRFLKEGKLPPADAVRIEELLNYFRYDYPQPQGAEPFSMTTELSGCPWNPEHQLLRVGLQGRRTESKQAPPRNLVFLLDVSGSMESADKLPLVKRSMRLLLETMGKQDRVAIVVYAGSEGLALPSTSCDQRALISQKLETLEANGTTNGAAGIQLAYEVARQNFRTGAINRVILCTDGDFNVGLTGGSLVRLIEKEREAGIFLTVLGFGTGNLKDDTMESLADKGNGNYAYIDSLLEAKRVLVRESGGTLETIAKDVKLQLEFNPKRVHSYRLIGYENRRLEDEDFADDKKDAGELGAGHNVTALYELVTDGPTQSNSLRYQNGPTFTEHANSQELAMLKLRYKTPTSQASALLEFAINLQPVAFAKASPDHRFAASVAAFGMTLRDSTYSGGLDLFQVSQWAREATGAEPNEERQGFLTLIEMARSLEAASQGSK